jgi:hypothetical protein
LAAQSKAFFGSSLWSPFLSVSLCGKLCVSWWLVSKPSNKNHMAQQAASSPRVVFTQPLLRQSAVGTGIRNADDCREAAVAAGSTIALRLRTPGSS